MGVAESSAGNENAVRIMSIHKSRGLEFPIVFVSGLSKKFNKQDARERIALHPELGLGVDAIDPKRRIKIPTIRKKMIQKQIELESLGEELRVLYVALTRAKEKLIMTVTLGDAAKTMVSLSEEKEYCKRGTYESLCTGTSFLDWILQVSAGEQLPYEVSTVSVESLVEKKIEQILQHSYNYGALREKQAEIPEWLKEKFSYVYPYEKEMNIPGKVSVSELKKEAMDEMVLEMFEEPETVPYVPAFLREERKGTGAERGTAYHRVMECIDLSKIMHSDEVKEQIAQLVVS
jgi:ATP-dependent helicase/nuclease subunit A